MTNDDSGTAQSAGLRPSQMSPAQFLDTFGDVYEHSPWIARDLLARGLDSRADSAEGLASVMAEVVSAASDQQKRDLLRAHPDLAGRLALAGEMTASSVSEQAAAGLDNCTAEEVAQFQDLNGRYIEKFGFPFILAVRGHQRWEILEVFASRLTNEPETEFAEALDQVNRIATLRIQDRFAMAPR